MSIAPGAGWQSLDWEALDRLRARFLSGGPAHTPYWRSLSDLAAYDLTYGERIGWKWDAVLAELRERGFTPPGGPVLDWGCGSGIAGRRVARFLGPGCVSSLLLHDRSPLAIEFAREAARREFPALEVAPWREDSAVGVLVVSHVLVELSARDRAGLLRLAGRAASVLWVEPGDREGSRAIVAVREELRERFEVFAPCTHRAPCGMLAPENERHWCHSFASPPPGLAGDPNWARFARRAGIDLRSLPYSFLALTRRETRPEPGLSRVIGEPRRYQGYARVLACQEEGVRELTLRKRDCPDVYRAWKKGGCTPLWRWERDGDLIRSATPS